MTEALKRAQERYRKTKKGKLAHKRAVDKYCTSIGHATVIFRSTQQSMKKKGMKFDLNLEDFKYWWDVTPSICDYCGISIEEFLILKKSILEYKGEIWKIKRFKKMFISSKHQNINWLTIDRIDNSQGYFFSNITKVCWICNFLKSDFFTKNEIKTIMPKIIKDLKYNLDKRG